MEPTNSNIDGRYYGSVDKNVHSPVERETWKEMAQHLYTDMNQLWQKQSLLVSTELNEKIAEIKIAAGSLAVGAALLLVGLFALVATAIILIDLVAPLWLSALLVTTVLLVVGAVMLMGAKKKLKADKIKPEKSIETFGEIRNTFQERIHEFKQH